MPKCTTCLKETDLYVYLYLTDHECAECAGVTVEVECDPEDM